MSRTLLVASSLAFVLAGAGTFWLLHSRDVRESTGDARVRTALHDATALAAVGPAARAEPSRGPQAATVPLEEPAPRASGDDPFARFGDADVQRVLADNPELRETIRMLLEDPDPAVREEGTRAMREILDTLARTRAEE